MEPKFITLEALRWGCANVPGVIFAYAKELDLDMEDLGIIAIMFYVLEQGKPLYQTGINVGQVLRLCPTLTKQKLSKKLASLDKRGVITVTGVRSFTDRLIYLEPLMEKIELIILRDHPEFTSPRPEAELKPSDSENKELLAEYQNKIELLEQQLAEEKSMQTTQELLRTSNQGYKKVADFIAKKTGNLLSVKMANELKRWLEELAFTPEFLLCMLELCFERKIYAPRDITRIARDLCEYSVNTVEGLEHYFKSYVDTPKSRAIRGGQFNPDIVEFGNFTGIDMNAEARRKIYYKWRYDWGFSHLLIMKAGEVMCQRTKNGGLEYIDSVLNNWMSKEIRQVDEAEKEIREFKAKNKKDKSAAQEGKKRPPKPQTSEYEIYVSPSSLEELKSNV